jgi:hypothetical protein
MNTSGDVRWCYTLLENCSHKFMTQSSVHHIQSVTSHSRFFKKKGLIILLFLKANHPLTFRESPSCSVTSLGSSLPHTELCLLTVPHTWNVPPVDKHGPSDVDFVLNAGKHLYGKLQKKGGVTTPNELAHSECRLSFRNRIVFLYCHLRRLTCNITYKQKFLQS